MLEKDLLLPKMTDIKVFISNVSKATHPVYAARGELKVDAKSLLGLLSIDPSQKFTLIFDEEDADLITSFLF